MTLLPQVPGSNSHSLLPVSLCLVHCLYQFKASQELFADGELLMASDGIKSRGRMQGVAVWKSFLKQLLPGLPWNLPTKAWNSLTFSLSHRAPAHTWYTVGLQGTSHSSSW